jgi:hypothetical protein
VGRLTVPAGGSVTVHFTVSIASALKKKDDSIVNDGYKATPTAASRRPARRS